MQLKALIQTPAGDFEKSKSFYSKLGFELVQDGVRTLATDGKLIVEINPHEHARTGLKLLSPDWSATVERLKELTQIHKTEEGFLLSDPNGVKVYLADESAIRIPPTTDPFGSLGNFTGICIETTDMARSAEFWQRLGYGVTGGNPSGGWMGLSAAGWIDVNLMKTETCPHLFPNPGLTYFNSGKNAAVIEKIRRAGVPIAQEITRFSKDGSVENVILQDPAGTGFFIFND